MSKGVAGIRFGGAGSNGTVTGTGTTNRFAIWTSSTAIGDSSWENSSGNFRPITDNTYDIGDNTRYVRVSYHNIVDYSSSYTFKKGGVQSAIIDSSGNLGVGGSPSYKIHAITSANNAGLVHTAGTLVIASYIDGTRTSFGSFSNNDMNLMTGGQTTSYMLYLAHSTKSVGAGTNSPSGSTRFHAVGDRLARSAISGQVDNTSTTLGTGYPAFELVNGDSTTNNWSYLTFGSSVGGSFFASIACQYVNRGSAYGDLYFSQRTSAGYINMLSIVQGKIGLGAGVTPSSVVQIGAGTATANTAPLQLTSGTSETTARSGLIQFSSTSASGIQTISGSRFTVTESDTTERYIVQAATSVKTTAAAPYTNDGYVSVVINGTTVKLMTTA